MIRLDVSVEEKVKKDGVDVLRRHETEGNRGSMALALLASAQPGWLRTLVGLKTKPNLPHNPHLKGSEQLGVRCF